MEDTPIGRDFAGRFLNAGQLTTQVEPLILSAGWEALQRQAIAEQVLDGFGSAVGGPVVDDVHLDPLRQKPPSLLAHDVDLVVCRHERDHAKSLWRHPIDTAPERTTNEGDGM